MRRAGFTLIELLTTLAVVGVVAGALAASLGSTIQVRRATRDRLDRLEEVQRLVRSVRDDLESLAAVPHALEVQPESLVFLRRATAPPETPEPESSLVVVRYRRAGTPGPDRPVLREEWALDPAAWADWSSRSLGDGAGSILPRFALPDEAIAVFRHPDSVEWEALEFTDGEWRPHAGEDPGTIRAVDLRIAFDDAPASVSPRRGARRHEPWAIRIPLSLALVEEAQP